MFGGFKSPGIQSPSENGNGTQIPSWDGDYTPQSSSDKVIGSLGNPFWTLFASQKKIQTPKFNLPRKTGTEAKNGLVFVGSGGFPTLHLEAQSLEVWKFLKMIFLFKGVIFWNSHVSFRGCIQRELKLWDPKWKNKVYFNTFLSAKKNTYWLILVLR